MCYFNNFRHLYIPLGGSRHGLLRQLIATMVCYLFVFFWHGNAPYLFVWAALNFVDIAIEACAKLVSAMPAFQKFEVRNIQENIILFFFFLLGHAKVLHPLFLFCWPCANM